MLTPYTTNPQVRAAIGVALAEIRDTVLDLPLYQQALELDLVTLNSTLTVQFAAIGALPEPDRTYNQKVFYKVMQLYSTYSVANHLLTTYEMFAPERITDGAATMQRSETAWENTKAAVAAMYIRLAAALLAALEVLDPAQPVAPLAARIYSGNVGIALDPVTGV